MNLEPLSYYTNGILQKDRNVLSKSITLIESNADTHQATANQLIEFCIQQNKKAKKIGISGSPGVGKSTFINSLGKHILDNNKSIAVLAIDPSSTISRGSILGDKTRMGDLIHHKNIYIRPSANGDYLGGVARKTYETSLICEAFGFDYIIVETVGVGQSEIEVRNIVDIFLLLLLPNAGDELQGIKRGIMELANIIIINKADNEHLTKAKISMTQIKSILPLMNQQQRNWETKVVLASALENTGIKNIYNLISNYYLSVHENELRINQQEYWKNKIIQDLVLSKIKSHPKIKKVLEDLSIKQQNIYTNYEAIAKLIDEIILD